MKGFWGTFNGLHTVDVARAGFLIFGPSGSG
ncbi:ATP-binding protein [Corynebacterium glucuronolyticum]